MIHVFLGAEIKRIKNNAVSTIRLCFSPFFVKSDDIFMKTSFLSKSGNQLLISMAF